MDELQYKENFYFRNGLYGLAFLNVMFVLGTDSRGAFLGLAVFCLAYWVKSKNKMRDGFFMSLGGLVALAILSDEWFNRMETIGDANEDGTIDIFDVFMVFTCILSSTSEWNCFYPYPSSSLIIALIRLNDR